MRNRGSQGLGGAGASGGTASFTDCVFDDNFAPDAGMGGGLGVLDRSAVTLTRCTFARNVAGIARASMI